MAKASRRPIAVFKLSRFRRIGDFILRVRTIVLNIVNHPAIFATPVPPTADVTTNADKLEASEAVAQTRVTGSVAARDLQYDNVLDDVHDMLGYVQSLADNSADEATAVSIIEASGFDLKNRGVRVKPQLAVKRGMVSGSVDLTAKSAGKRVSYEWRSSSNGTDWTMLPPTLQAKTTVTGLTPGQAEYFSVRPVTKDGPGDWSAAVSIIVV